MSEDSFVSTRSGQFRGTRYPGFSSAASQVDSATGIGVATPGLTSNTPSVTGGGGSSNSLSMQSFDVPTVQQPSLGDMAKGLGGMAAQGAAQYATTKIGAVAGQQLANGAATGFGDAIGQGATSLASDVSGAIGTGYGFAGQMGSSAAEVGPYLSEFTSGANSLGAQAVSEGASQTAGSSLGSSVGSAASAPATSGINAGVSKLSDGANLGGAAGAGIGRAVIGIATGEKPAKALRAGAGSAVGYYAGTAIGTAIGGPVGGAVGGFIGSTIGSIFCFAAGTQIMMEDGSIKPVEALNMGDKVALGGMVIGQGQTFAASNNVFLYENTIVDGNHAVFEDGGWLRVSQSDRSVRAEVPEGFILYPVVTEHHLLLTPWFVAADFSEVDGSASYNDDQRLQLLNGDTRRNKLLSEYVERMIAP